MRSPTVAGEHVRDAYRTATRETLIRFPPYVMTTGTLPFVTRPTTRMLPRSAMPVRAFTQVLHVPFVTRSSRLAYPQHVQYALPAAMPFG